MEVTVQGMPNAQAQFARIIRGCVSISQTVVEVGSRLPYGYGIEFGRHRESDKLARRAGGSHYLERAKTSVLTDADRDLSEGLSRVTAPGPWILTRLAKWVRRLARTNVPIGTDRYTIKKVRRRTGEKYTKTLVGGRLRRSININRVKA
jgi:hypothetical protein